MALISAAVFRSLRWRLFLVLIGLGIVLVSGVYTLSVSSALQEEERRHLQLWAEAQERLYGADEAQLEVCDFTLHSLIQTQNTNIPCILTDASYRIVDVLNYKDREYPRDKVFFETELEYLRRYAEPPIVIETADYKSFIFYRPSALIVQLEWFPYIQFGLLGIFLFLAYLSLRSVLLAEKERIWVGMAKETAHQLGTPISSLIGWIDYLKASFPDNEEIDMVTEELGRDVNLLQVVAERFSKIGAKAELEAINLYDRLDRHLSYVKQRASRKIVFDFPDTKVLSPLPVKVNPLLFDWVIENLLKNALDAMESGEGEVSVSVEEDDKYVYIDLSDTGKGMPKKLFKQIFEPGFTTKKRGWGLGLSLCKRIIEQYHKGQIFVKSSTPGMGTTFRIQLKKHH